MRALPAALAILCAAPAARAEDVPRGHRLPRPKPTHVVVRDAELDAQGALGTAHAGVGVIVTGALPRTGKVPVTLAGAVELSGRMDVAALGTRLAADADAWSEDGRDKVGHLRVGAFVTVVGPGPGKLMLVETVGPVHARLAVTRAALAPEPTELVLLSAQDGTIVGVGEPADLLSGPDGRKRARLDAGALVVLHDDKGAAALARVRTYGGAELDGWIARKKLVPTETLPGPEAPDRGLNPNREALVDVAVFADAEGKKPIGRLRGGALVTAARQEQAGRVKAMTHGDVVIEAWIDTAGLRAVDPRTWSEGP